MERRGFRPDIEGLRALSVVAVVLYHARLPGFAGGFVGVDVFFVISGFLITGLLLAEMDKTGRVDIVAFWSRRARRLLPNALLTLAMILAVSTLVLPLAQQLSGSRDVIAALMYVANYRFAERTIDYFDPGLQSSPVLHFWSLSVEEQFYIGLPLLLTLLVLLPAYTRRRAVATLLVAAFVSFALMAFWMTRSQPRAFFDTEARIWQLAVGGLLAAAPGALARIAPPWRAGFAWLGLAGFLASIALYGDALAYPGGWALLPTLSAAALTIGGIAGNTAPARLLSTTPLQWIGKRSYSIYLWHWPILVLTPLVLPQLPYVDWISLALVLPVAAAAFAWVEDPIRRLQPDRLGSVRTLATAAAACALVGLAGIGLASIPLGRGPYASAVMQRLESARADGPRSTGCTPPGWGDAVQPPCVFGVPGAQRVVVLFGDSHAHHLFDGLNAAVHAEGWELRVYTKNSCPPIDVPVYDSKMRGEDKSCTIWRESIIQRLLTDKPDAVIIASWTGLARKLSEATGERLSTAASMALWQRGFEQVLSRLTGAGINVIVVRDTPRSQARYGSACLDRLIESECATPRLQAINAEMPDVVVAKRIPGVRVLDLTDRFCGRNSCPAVKDGNVVYRGDDNHLTATFSRTLAPAFSDVLIETGSLPAPKRK